MHACCYWAVSWQHRLQVAGQDLCERNATFARCRLRCIILRMMMIFCKMLHVHPCAWHQHLHCIGPANVVGVNMHWVSGCGVCTHTLAFECWLSVNTQLLLGGHLNRCAQ